MYPSEKSKPQPSGRLLLLAKKLCGKLALVDLADALNIPVEHAREFALEHERRRKALTDSKFGMCFMGESAVPSIAKHFEGTASSQDHPCQVMFASMLLILKLNV